MSKNKMLLSALLGIIGVIFVYFMAQSVVPKVLVTFTKAAPVSKVSLSSSYLLGGRILAKADGVDKCTVNVFVLDASSKGVSGKLVVLSGMKDDLEVVSDMDGKAQFEITSNAEGQYELSASVDGVALGRSLKVTFRN
ncbi:Ig-like domain-containing protein [Candidatus Shapirobacteria bacterium]|nr:Ig-like domain-containing protein [Candidatus Shapirobacteria bacterium]